jgi:Mycoplasma protein of unknown function, DUF285
MTHQTFTSQPVVARNREHLQSLISGEISKHGPTCSLNHIDVSGITDMNALFESHLDFNGDVSRWNVSNVTTMMFMFYSTQFNGNISQWDVSSVRIMSSMFSHSPFNRDIGTWRPHADVLCSAMFAHTPFEKDIRPWGLEHKWEKMFGEHDPNALHRYRDTLQQRDKSALLSLLSDKIKPCKHKQTPCL